MSSAKLTATFKKGVTLDEAWESLTKMFRGSVTTLILGGYGGSFRPVRSDEEIRGGTVFENGARRLEIRNWKPKYFFSYNEEILEGAFVRATMDFSIIQDEQALILEVERWEERIGWGKILPGSTAYKSLMIAISGQGYAQGWNDIPIENIQVTKGQ